MQFLSGGQAVPSSAVKTVGVTGQSNINLNLLCAAYVFACLQVNDNAYIIIIVLLLAPSQCKRVCLLVPFRTLKRQKIQGGKPIELVG